ncbi:MAG TPA: DUF2199 domain-containing protein [Pseudomonadales bacterium]|nr:DUF2199 domain-containing protein [Pseudomonadales bacterium]
MSVSFAFRCECCGELHEGSPSFTFAAPDPYVNLSSAQQAAAGTLDGDLCVIAHDRGADRFVRAVLEVPIHGVDAPFLWGVWVSLGEHSFRRYLESFEAPVAGDGYFGWVCNEIALYPHGDPRPADLLVQTAGSRPRVVLHRGDPEDDPLVIDQLDGISPARAQALATRALHGHRPRA